MENHKSIKFNFVMNSILSASAILFPLITFPYVSRVLQPDGLGVVNFATSVVTYFSMFAQMGIPTYGIRATAKVRDDKEALSRIVQEIFFINMVMCICIYIVFICSICFVPKLASEKTLFILMGINILFNAIGMDWLYKGLEKYAYITVRSLVFKAIAVVLMLLLIREKNDYIIYGGLTIFAGVGSHALNFINLRKYIYMRPLKNYHIKPHLKPICIFFAMSIATTVYTNLDNVMLGFMSGNTENGYYAAAVKIKTLLVNFVASLGTVLLPRVSYYIQKGMNDEFRKITKKALNFVLLLSVPLTVYFIIFATPSIRILAGSSYDGAIFPMRLIMPTLIFIGLTNIMGIQIMVPMGKEKYVLISEIAGAIVDLIVNTMAIPKMGAAGAALGTTIAEIVVFIVQMIVLRKMIFSLFSKISFWKIFLAVGTGSVCSVWMLIFGFNTVIILFLSAIIFFSVYWITLMITKESLALNLTVQCVGIIKRRVGKADGY